MKVKKLEFKRRTIDVVSSYGFIETLPTDDLYMAITFESEDGKEKTYYFRGEPISEDRFKEVD